MKTALELLKELSDGLENGTEDIMSLIDHANYEELEGLADYALKCLLERPDDATFYLKELFHVARTAYRRGENAQPTWQLALAHNICEFSEWTLQEAEIWIQEVESVIN